MRPPGKGSGVPLFRRNFASDGIWRGRRYRTKQIEAYAALEDDAWLVITVVVKYF